MSINYRSSKCLNEITFLLVILSHLHFHLLNVYKFICDVEGILSLHIFHHFFHSKFSIFQFSSYFSNIYVYICVTLLYFNHVTTVNDMVAW